MNRIFVTADLHLGHKKILDFEGQTRPFANLKEHDEAIVQYWNETVKPKDTVWVLGDVAFSREALNEVRKMNGIKRLVLGNHDTQDVYAYMNYFDSIFGAVRLRECILTHIPIHPSQFYRFKANIHGHMHRAEINDYRYCNVSLEKTNLRPILLDKVISDIDKRLGERAE